MIGPPGTGKTLLAKRLPTILPPLTPAESLETTRIYSAMGLLKAGQALMAIRPFRPPHHSVSDAGLVGGGTTPQPGEISLAHKGVLFLDEMPEFNRKTLEVLRQPLEEGWVTISRALRSTTFPAEFILVAAMNPCPCGYRSDPRRACSCTPPQVEKYLSKISGPLLDRIDLHVEVPAVPFTQLAEMPPGPTSADLRAQVLEARARQSKRFGAKGPQVNGRMTPRQVRKFCALKPEAMALLKAAMEDLGLSARAHDKVLRVARTIADLEGTRRHQAAAHRRGGRLSVARSQRVGVAAAGGLRPFLAQFGELLPSLHHRRLGSQQEITYRVQNRHQAKKPGLFAVDQFLRVALPSVLWPERTPGPLVRAGCGRRGPGVLRRLAGGNLPKDRSVPSDRIDTGTAEPGHTNATRRRRTLAEASACDRPSSRLRVGLVWPQARPWLLISCRST